jgi:L-ascorbate metabolism protein UlaG (beta-lactamase superfamily)
MRFRKLLLTAVTVWVVLLAAAACSDPVQEPSLEVTYVANTGFIVECGGRKVLIDALFGGFEADWCYVPDDSIVDLMKTAQPPFDRVDLIAVTHAHVDHVSLGITAAYLAASPKTFLVCPPQLKEKLAARDDYHVYRDRINAPSLPRDSVHRVEMAGIGVKILSGRHSSYSEEDPETGEVVDRHRDVQHYEYVLELGGKTVYHAGDAAMNDRLRYEALHLDRDSIEVAFVGWWDERPMASFREKLIRDLITPRRVILTHMWPNRPPKGHPERRQNAAGQVILPQRPMERWTFP